MLANAVMLRRVPSGVLRVEPDRRSVRMGLHKRLDVEPAWPARGRERGAQRFNAVPVACSVMRNLFATGSMPRWHTRLTEAPPDRHRQHRSCRASEPSSSLCRYRALWAGVDP